MVYESNYRPVYSDELYHYGVKGMKWGQHKYATDYRNSMRSARSQYKLAKKAANDRYEQAGAAWEKATNGGRKSNRNADSALDRAADQWGMDRKAAKSQYRQAKTQAKLTKKSDPEYQARVAKTKKAAKIGAAVAGTALAAYGAYKLNKFIRNSNENIRIGKNLAEANHTLNLLDQGNTYAKRNNTLSNATIKSMNDRFNATAKSMLDSAVNSGKRDAANDSFATAAKNVYNHYRNK